MAKQLTFEDVQRIAEDEVSKYCDKLTESAVRKIVRDRLNQQVNETVLKVIGFENRWGKWEVDHCNGRMSALSELVKNVAQSEFQTWFKENMGRGPKLTTEQRKAIVCEFDEAVLRAAREAAKRKAADLGSKALNNALAGAVGPVIHDEVWDLLQGTGDVADD